MEKVKLPKEICDILDKAGESKFDDYFLWNAIQWDVEKMATDEKYKLNRFANVRGTLKLAKAILHGYEPEETEEEKLERIFRNKKLNEIKNYLYGRIKQEEKLKDYANEIYEIMKKIN